MGPCSQLIRSASVMAASASRARSSGERWGSSQGWSAAAARWTVCAAKRAASTHTAARGEDRRDMGRFLQVCFPAG